MPVWPNGFEGPIADAVSMAAHVEWEVEQIIRLGLWRTPELAEMLIRSLATSKQVDAAEKLVVDLFPETAAEKRAAFVLVRRARQARNELLHRVWRTAPDGRLEAQQRPGRAAIEPRDLAAFEQLSSQLALAGLSLVLIEDELFRWSRMERARTEPTGTA